MCSFQRIKSFTDNGITETRKPRIQIDDSDEQPRVAELPRHESREWNSHPNSDRSGQNSCRDDASGLRQMIECK
jgi:hypothetical protein